MRSKCFNLPGTYECKCSEGFRGDGFNCSDIDECYESHSQKETDNATCSDIYHKCVNTYGSFECICKEGFLQTSNGDGECLGIDFDNK